MRRLLPVSFFFIAFLSAALARAQSVTLAADEWCPYNCAPGDAKPGYVLEIAQRALAKRGVKVNYVTMPWTKALTDAAAGRIDGVIGATKAEFPSGVFPRLPQGRNETVLVTNGEFPFVYSGPASLRTLRIAAVKNYTYDNGPIDAYFASKEAKGKVDFAWGEQVHTQNMNKLLTKKVDIWIENRSVVLSYVAKLSPLPNIKLTSIGVSEPIYIAFSPGKPDSTLYAGLVGAEVTHLRKTGELSQILAKYNLRDWE